MKARAPRRSTIRPAIGDRTQDRQPEHRERQPDQGQVRAEALEEQAPDDLVRATGVVAAGVDDEGRDEPAVEQAHRPPGLGPADLGLGRGMVGGEVGGQPSLEERRVRREGRPVRRRRRVDVPLVALLADPERDADRRDDRGDRAEHEHERDATELGRPERADRRAEEQAAHLGRPVQPERLAAPVRWRGVGQEAAGGGVVDRRAQTGAGAQQHEGECPGQDQRQRPEDARHHQPDDHERHALRPVGQPAEDGFADQPRRRPRGDDDTERREVDALLDEVQREDRQQATEPEPDDEFGDEQRQDRRPSARAKRSRGRADARLGAAGSTSDPCSEVGPPAYRWPRPARRAVAALVPVGRSTGR